MGDHQGRGGTTAAGLGRGVTRADRAWANPLFGRLVFTPDFLSIQGSEWLVHCAAPMTFVGRWGQGDFQSHAPDGDGQRYAPEIASMHADAWEGLAELDDEDSFVWAYAFRCGACGVDRANWDID